MDMQNSSKPGQPSPFDWLPPRWLQIPISALQSVLGWSAAVVSMVCCMVFVHHGFPQISFVGLVLTPLLALPTVAIHEYGHLLGARATGMTVSHVFVGPLQFVAQRHGWRMRWRRLKRNASVHGFVMAYPDPERPMRAACMLMTAAGPAASLLAGATAAAIALVLGDSAFGWLAVGMAVLNLTVGVANLLPTSRQAPSDGLLLLRWLRCKDEEAVPELHFSRLNALSIKGVLDEDLPSDQVDALADMPMPMPLLHSWIVLKRHQHTGRWNEGVALAGLMEERIAAVQDEWKPSFDALIRALRCEMRFTRCMAGLPDDAVIDHELGAECDWHYPWLRPRCHALLAAITSDGTSTRRHLEEARQWAERSIDRGLETSEAVLAQAILSKLELAESREQPRAPAHNREPYAELPAHAL